MDDFPQWQLERYVLGELPLPELEVLRRRIEADPALRARVEQLEAENRAFLARRPAQQIGTEVRRRSRKQTRSAQWIRPAAPLLALACAVAVFVIPRGSTQEETTRLKGPPLTETTRLKGPQALFIYRQNGTKTERFNSGEIARAGDVLQLRYRVGVAGLYGMVVSVDGRGVVTTHLGDEAGSVALVPGAESSLPASYKLDDAPKFERFFLLTRAKPFGSEEVLAAVNAWATRAQAQELALPPDFEQHSVLVQKE